MPFTGFINAGYATGQIVMTPSNGIKVTKVGYKGTGPETNYYGLMRILDIIDTEFSIDKSLLTT